MPWRRPEPADADWLAGNPWIGRFGDETVAVAAFEGRRWIVRERDWHGWPDPPRYVLLVVEGETVWAARDFDRWPRAWLLP